MTEIERECRIGIGELYRKAYESDPKKADDLRDLWESTDLTNKELVFGL